MQFQLDSKTILNSTFKRKTDTLSTTVSKRTLMNFDNLILNDLMTGVYPVSFDFDLLTLTDAPHCVIECVKELKFH